MEGAQKESINCVQVFGRKVIKTLLFLTCCKLISVKPKSRVNTEMLIILNHYVMETDFVFNSFRKQPQPLHIVKEGMV